MFGDQFQNGFNFQSGFQGGFQQGGGFSSGFNFQGGFHSGFNGGAPIAVARGAFKIAENGSPQPQDRVFTSYNYYDDVRRVLEVHRETIGFEKTFLDGRASVEMRLPFFQNHAEGGGNESETADLNTIFKYAFVDAPDLVLSAGLVVTAPTSNIPTVLIIRSTGISKVHPTLLQPFVGYLWGANNFFVHGFSSVMVPTDSRDGTLLFNDVGIGYWLRRDERLLSAVVPTFETHVNTPLAYRGSPGFRDSVDLTTGSYFFLGERLCLGTAVGTTVTGPRLFAFEALVNLNWRF